MVRDLRMLMRESEGRTLQSSPESGGRAGHDVALGGHDGHKRHKGSKVHLAVDTLGQLLVERSFAWMARFRRLARDYERLLETLVGLHFVAFAILPAHRFVTCMVQSA